VASIKAMNVDALFEIFLLSSTVIVSVGVGILGAHYAISGLLAVLNSTRPSESLHALVPQQGQASGD